MVCKSIKCEEFMNNVSAIVRTDLLIYSIILNGIMYYYLTTNIKRKCRSTKLFKRILASTIFVTIAEVISWSTGEIGNSSQITIHYWSNFVFLSSIGLTSAFGLNYLDYKIFNNESVITKRLHIYLIPTFINIGFAIYNHFNRGFLFYIHESNQYYRGVGVIISNVILYVFAIIVVLSFYRHRHLITGRTSQAITVFVFIPVVGSILQTLTYGTTFGMPAYTLASFLTYLLIEKDEMSRDPLTQLYTRANFENRLRYKLRSNEAFTLIMLDLNDFKHINDTYGHLEGDHVLKCVSDILQHNANVEDMVCRYGGDEFFVLLENQENIGPTFIDRLNHMIDKHNNEHPDKCPIGLSCGYEYVNHSKNISLETLIHGIDQKMYEDKEKKKQS